MFLTYFSALMNGVQPNIGFNPHEELGVFLLQCKVARSLCLRVELEL